MLPLTIPSLSTLDSTSTWHKADGSLKTEVSSYYLMGLASAIFLMTYIVIFAMLTAVGVYVSLDDEDDEDDEDEWS